MRPCECGVTTAAYCGASDAASEHNRSKGARVLRAVWGRLVKKLKRFLPPTGVSLATDWVTDQHALRPLRSTPTRTHLLQFPP